MSEYRGTLFVLNRSLVTQTRINAEEVKKILSPAQLEMVSREVSYHQMRTTRYAGRRVFPRAPNLDGYSLEQLIDGLGMLKEKEQRYKQEENLFKEIIERMINPEE